MKRQYTLTERPKGTWTLEDQGEQGDVQITARATYADEAMADVCRAYYELWGEPLAGRIEIIRLPTSL